MDNRRKSRLSVAEAWEVRSLPVPRASMLIQLEIGVGRPVAPARDALQGAGDPSVTSEPWAPAPDATSSLRPQQGRRHLRPRRGRSLEWRQGCGSRAPSSCDSVRGPSPRPWTSNHRRELEPEGDRNPPSTAGSAGKTYGPAGSSVRRSNPPGGNKGSPSFLLLLLTFKKITFIYLLNNLGSK